MFNHKFGSWFVVQNQFFIAFYLKPLAGWMQSFFWTPKIEPMLLLLLPFLSSTLSNWKEWSCREWYILVKVCGEHWDFCPKAKNCFSFLVGVPFTLRDTSPTHPQGLGLAYLMHVWGVEYLIAALCVSCYLNIITEAKHTHSSYKYAPSFVVWITRAICAHTVYCARDSPPGKGGGGLGGITDGKTCCQCRLVRLKDSTTQRNHRSKKHF